MDDKTMKWGDEAACEALARYETIVRRQAWRLLPAVGDSNVLDLDDLIAEGRIGVLEALDTYRDFGASELTWVRVRVRQRMIDAIRRCAIRSRGETRLLAEAASAGDGANDERARQIAARRVLSIDGAPDPDRLLSQRVGGSSGWPSADEAAERSQQSRRLLRALSLLPQRQREAVSMTLFEGMRPGRVSQKMGICAGRVTQLQRRAVERLREAMDDPGCWSIVPPHSAAARVGA